MANSKELRLRTQATFLKINHEDIWKLKELKDLITLKCPDGFRAWLSKAGKIGEYSKFRDAMDRDHRARGHQRDRNGRRRKARAVPKMR